MERVALRVFAVIAPSCALAACATLPEPAGGGGNLPNAGAGPFRALVSTELGNARAAPNGLDDRRSFARDVAVVDLDGDPETLEVAAYVAAAVRESGVDPTASTPTRSIVRYGALDGRSFDRAGEVVLTPDAPWEGDVLASPAAIRVGGALFLYYAAAGGIGLATSADGHAFTKTAGPVLAPDASGWELGRAPASPGIVKLADGSLRMFYEIALDGGSAIGEARSADGVSFTRIGTAPALSPIGASAKPWDAASVGSPFPIPVTSSEGETILRVYYGATDASGERTIGLAARYGDDGPLERAASPVFGTSKPLEPREPCVVAFSNFTLLYATEASSTTDTHPAIAIGVAPATAVLPPPNPK